MSAENKAGSDEPLRIAFAPPHEVVNTAEGEVTRGGILLNRPLRDGEMDDVQAAVESLGIKTSRPDGIEVSERKGRSFGQPRWNTPWEPKPIWGTGQARNAKKN